MGEQVRFKALEMKFDSMTEAARSGTLPKQPAFPILGGAHHVEGRRKMRNALVLFLAALFATSVGFARTWTNAEGKTLEGDLVKMEGGQVYLRLSKDGSVHPMKMEWLCEVDQDYVCQFAKEQEARRKAEERANRTASWLTDYDDVKDEAEKFNYPVLLLYTAPQWCGYCVMLERNILGEDEFAEYANGHLVLFLADFSSSDNAASWREEYPELAEKFPVNGYPCAYLISPSGEKLGRIGGCDANWRPKDYIDQLEVFRKKIK